MHYFRNFQWVHEHHNADKTEITRTECLRIPPIPLLPNRIMACDDVLVIRLFNTLRLRQNGHISRWHFEMHFLEWKYMSFDWNYFVPKGLINNIPALVQMAGAKPLSETMMASLLTHICVTRSQWVNWPLVVKLQSSCFSNYVVYLLIPESRRIVCVCGVEFDVD